MIIVRPNEATSMCSKPSKVWTSKTKVLQLPAAGVRHG